MNEGTRDMEELVRRWGVLDERIRKDTEDRDRLGWAITRSMQEDGATALDHPTHVVELATKNEWDRSKLHPLRELIPPEVLAKGYTPEHEETVVVAESWNMQQVKTWVKYGNRVQAIIEGAAKPKPPVLAIRPKEPK